MKNKLLLFFLILPLLIPMCLIFYHGSYVTHEWRIKIQGYDPRDILRGRYIEFRYDFGDTITKKEIGGSLCLNGDKENPNIIIVNPHFNKCQDIIKNYKPYRDERQRFYIPENLADRADKIVRGNIDDISAGINVRNGSIVLKNLYYKDDSLIQYLKDNP